MIPQERSIGEISWHMFTIYSLENIPSPVANYLQNGFFTIKKLLAHDVLSWLSKINLFAFEMFVNESDLDTERGIVQITFLPLN